MRPNIIILSSLAIIAVTASAAETSQYIIEINDSGQITHAGKALALTSLATDITELSKSNKDSQVLISASEHAPLEVVTKVMDTCRKAGITKFMLQSK